MTICLKNKCKFSVIVNVNDKNIEIGPYESKSVILQFKDKIHISICRNINSCVIRGIYNLNLKTQYVYSNVKDNEEFIITRERIRFSSEASYERLFLKSTGPINMFETSKVSDEEHIKRKYNRSQKIKLLYGPFENLPSLTVLLIILGVVLSCVFDNKIAIFYFPCMILFIYILNWFIQVIWKVFIKQAFDIDEKKQFFEYLEEDYINKYYLNSDREPFMGKVDTD